MPVNIVSLLALSRTFKITKCILQTSGHDFHKGTQVAFIGTRERLQVLIAILATDNDWWIARADQFQVGDRPTRAPVAILERVDVFEPSMQN